METRRIFAGVFVVLSTVPSTVFENLSSAEIHASLNGSTFAFDKFRKAFHRLYEGSGDEFKRRLQNLQTEGDVVMLEDREGSCLVGVSMDASFVGMGIENQFLLRTSSLHFNSCQRIPLLILFSPSHVTTHIGTWPSRWRYEGFQKTLQLISQKQQPEVVQIMNLLQESAVRHTHLNSFSTEALSATYGFNQFSDLSQEEFRGIYLQATGGRVPPFSGLPTEGLPTRFDWRDKAVVASVQDQLAVQLLKLCPVQCGSCWAFSVVGAVQSAHAVRGSQLQQLSVQQLLDCSFTNKGCDGGSPTAALSWLQQTREPLVTAAEYPYQAEARICRFFSQTHQGVAVKNFTVHNFRGQEPAMMAQLVEHGPLVAVVDAVSWQDYLGGIIQHHCSSQWPNHAVLVVGYDTSGEVPYWIVQNSWGTSWGNEGYVYIKMGGDICGIADSVAAVSV